MEGGHKDLMKSFVSESELAEVKRRRQEEWEKSRKPGQPLERPEFPADNRSLYERLQEQKREKDAKYEEEHRFSNQIRRLDEDDANFLSLVNQQHNEVLKQNEREEQQLLQELNEHRTRQAASSAKLPKIILPSAKVIPGSAKRKRTLDDEKEPKIKKLETSVISNSLSSAASVIQAESVDQSAGDTLKTVSTGSHHSCLNKQLRSVVPKNTNNDGEQRRGAIEVIGFLPGIGSYVRDGESSSSDSDSDDEGSLLKCFTRKHYTQKQMLKLMRKGS